MEILTNKIYIFYCSVAFAYTKEIKNNVIKQSLLV